MSKRTALEISRDPLYQKLVGSRARTSWILTATMLLVYYGFIFLVAFKRDLMSTTLLGGVTSLSVAAGVGVILFTVAVTGIYVRKANREFDVLTEKIRQENSH